ncbi:MAG: NADPH-dependent assimilatory sulfite reductase hemoprotein subunit [Aggregatilineales bacterium]
MMGKESVETIKAESRGLRGTLAAELANGESGLTDAAKNLLKFHGSYQQEDRDVRKADKGEKHFQFMIRSKIPGGQMTADQYLLHDALASEYGNDTIRITTRQAIQLHGVIKTDLPGTIRRLNGALVTTFGACGDVVRNVMACPAPTANVQERAVQKLAAELSSALLPSTKAYHQIWIDGQELIDEEDALYGQTYLPRKFKVAIALPGDNCVDVFTDDVGLIAIFDEDSNQLQGFNVAVGGGMGLTHNNAETFARLADVVGFVEPDQVIETVKAVVTIHRDFGDRANRKHARLKYVLHEWGIEKFREELQSRVPFAIQPARSMPPFHVHDHLGWNDQGDGQWALGIPVENGRIVDRGAFKLRTALRTVAEKYQTGIRLTAQQNILLTDVDAADRDAIDALLAEHHVLNVKAISGVRRYGLACPALPTCGLAITEAERVLPSVIDELEDILDDLGIPNEPIAVRMTGCPNGCARPYSAEIAFVGRSLNKYTVYLGGNFVGTRLAAPFLDLVPINELASALRSVLMLFRDMRDPGESFGDFVQRIGLDTLRDQVLAVLPDAKAPKV